MEKGSSIKKKEATYRDVSVELEQLTREANGLYNKSSDVAVAVIAGTSPIDQKDGVPTDLYSEVLPEKMMQCILDIRQSLDKTSNVLGSIVAITGVED